MCVYTLVSLCLANLERESLVIAGLEEAVDYNFTVTVHTIVGPNSPADTPPAVLATTDEAG